MIQDLLIHAKEYIVSNNYWFKYKAKIFIIPTLIILFSFLVHLKKAFRKKREYFTALFCRFALIGIVFELIGLTNYVFIDWSNNEIITENTIMWIAIMSVGGIIQLVSPFFIKSAEIFYQTKYKK